jgi:hypothetical protein
VNPRRARLPSLVGACFVGSCIDVSIQRERAFCAATRELQKPPTSIDNMSPLNRFVRTLASIPVAPGIAVNSIIAVEGDGPPEDGNDGVVTYQSAYIDGAESTLVVRSGHSAQGNAAAIEEIRRILLEHADIR